MAGDIAGMFSQINSAMGQNPLGGEMGGNLMNQLSQQVGGAMGAATGRDPMEFQSPEAKKLEAQKQIAKLDLSTVEGLKQAAQLYQQSGDVDKALAATEKARQVQAAQNAKNNAILEAKNAEVQEEAARKKKHSQKVQSILLAKRDGDTAAVDALQAGAMSPEAYLLKRTEKKNDKLTTLADGAMAIDADGNVVAHNPKDITDSGNRDLTATMQKRLNSVTDSYYDNTALANEYDGLLQRIDSIDIEGGWLGSAEAEINKATGRREDDDWFRTQAIKLKNHEAIKTLPPGPASDRDIMIVQKGFPPDNAPKKEWKEFFESQARIAKHAAEFDKAKADHISQYGDERNFVKEWDSKMAKRGEAQRREATPEKAIQDLQANPQLRDDFLARFGWLPEGF